MEQGQHDARRHGGGIRQHRQKEIDLPAAVVPQRRLVACRKLLTVETVAAVVNGVVVMEHIDGNHQRHAEMEQGVAQVQALGHVLGQQIHALGDGDLNDGHLCGDQQGLAAVPREMDTGCLGRFSETHRMSSLDM